MRHLGCLLTILVFVPVASAADFQPDPHSVQVFGPAYRYPQAGWIVLHVEGDASYELRCVQHGRLLAPEIASERPLPGGLLRIAKALRRFVGSTRGPWSIPSSCAALRQKSSKR